MAVTVRLSTGAGAGRKAVLVALQEITFTSANGRDTVQAWVYEPVGTPTAVVQVVHGLGEHSRRYLHLTSTLLDAGFVVVADDHAGHGRTAMGSGCGPTPATTPPGSWWPTRCTSRPRPATRCPG